MEPLVLPLASLGNGRFEREKSQGAGGKTEFSFGDALWRALREVDALQKEAEQKSLEVALGGAKSFHEIVIATEKATLALQLFIQFQNKLLDAYHEIMRLQI